MKQEPPTKEFVSMPVIYSLQQTLQSVSDKCLSCKLCKKECAFLMKYGQPKQIADTYDPANKNHQGMAFECSLCELCAAICPVGVNPANMFLKMRCEVVRAGNGNFSEHERILAYEKRGTSQRYSYYALPKNCDTILFPGCTLPGTRPEKTWILFERLKNKIPNLGIVLDCCTKPSHDLGREDYFTAMFGEMKAYLINNGIQKVFVACPNCFKIFNKYGENLSVKSVYEFMSQDRLLSKKQIKKTVTIHDPCSVRYDESIHSAVRKLCEQQGLSIEEMPHHKKKTFCCGEGGSVGFITPDYAKKWTKLIKDETKGNRIITYCAGCANFLGATTPTSHILDIVFEANKTLAGNVKVSKAPITYLNRIKLKKKFERTINTHIKRERTFTVNTTKKKGGLIKRLIFFTAIIGGILTIRLTGATQYLEQEKLRALIQGYHALAPAIYIFLYTIAPALFLPGLPITIVGGILFGPFWGVVYTIIGSTIGACVAFLISRYLARDWITSKLNSPRWRHLDERAEQHGWKVVAFTRLIPIFPFNLLNYALGLTKIRFFEYAITTFICMLPACIALIVLSSSLLEVIQGNISPTFIAGILMIVTLSLIPVLYKRRKQKGD